jgi:two-component system LytT family sensor kinase
MVESTMNGISQLEEQLSRQLDPEKRLFLLDELSVCYTFTNIQKAQAMLNELQISLLDYPHPDVELNYYWHAALVENQLYQYPRAAEYFQKALDLVEDRGSVEQQADLLIDYAGTCINLGDYDRTIGLLDRATRYLELFPDERLSARIICREGVLNLHVSNVARAIELLLEADHRISKLESDLLLKDYYFLTIIHSGLGEVYQQSGEIEKSVQANLKVLELCRRIGMRTRLSWHYLNIGRGYIALDQIEEAARYFQLALDNSEDGSEAARAGAFANLGYCFSLQENFEKALELFRKAEKLYLHDEQANLSNLFTIENWRAKMFAEKGQTQEAFHHFSEAYEYAKRIPNYLQLSIVCKEIAEVYAGIEDFRNAFEYLQLSNDMQERYQEEWNRRTVLEMEVKYETEKKKQEAELLRLQASSLQLKALRAQMNPHFIYNALNSIQHYITSNDATQAARYLAKFAKLMRQSLDYSDQESISLEKEIEFLQDYLEINQKLRFEDQMDYQLYVDDELEEDIMGVPTMIVQPYVENAIEHGLRGRKNGLVKLEFYLEDEDNIRCIVEDNGIGRKKAGEQKKQRTYEREHRSKGTAITEKRLEVLRKSRTPETGSYVEIIDLKDESSGKALGTRVEIIIPIMEIQVKT